MKFFPAFTTGLGIYSAFWLYSGNLILGCVIAFLVMPETRGKTLTELSELFEKKSRLAKANQASIPSNKEIEVIQSEIRFAEKCANLKVK